MSAANLTGIKRIVHDSCVDIYNCVQKWRSTTSNMHSTVLAISQIKQRELSGEDIIFDDKYNHTIHDELTSLSEQLQSKLKDLVSIFEKMEKCSNKLIGLCKLSESQSSLNTSIDLNETCFQILPLSEFALLSKDIENMFREELKLKTNICKEICILEEKSTVCFFEACWKYEPKIHKAKLNYALNKMIFALDLQDQLL